jgi:ABC-type tungstate transport system permease subunit
MFNVSREVGRDRGAWNGEGSDMNYKDTVEYITEVTKAFLRGDKSRENYFKCLIWAHLQYRPEHDGEWAQLQGYIKGLVGPLEVEGKFSQ